MEKKLIAVAPHTGRHDSLVQAVGDAGGSVVEPAEAAAVIWADFFRPQDLEPVLTAAAAVEWVALPFAGIEPYVDLIRRRTDLQWTCARGVYARPVAEHAIALATAGLRHIVGYARETSWSAPHGNMLVDGRVTIFGGGGITRELIRLLQGWDCDITVVRRSATAMNGAHRVLTSDRATEAVEGADVVILALALTEETTGIVDAAVLGAMEPHAWLVNVARGPIVDTSALVKALVDGDIGGAALDVTDPEPLPEDHPLWSLPNAVVTPHIANTPEMGIPLLAAHIRTNVGNWISGSPLEGLVDPAAGY